MQFNFPDPVWEPNPTDDGFTLRMPYIGLYYSPYDSGTWWYGFRGDQIGSRTDPMTEDALRDMLYKKACQIIEDEYEIKTARVAQIEKLYGGPKLNSFERIADPDACSNLARTYDGDCMNCETIAALHDV